MNLTRVRSFELYKIINSIPYLGKLYQWMGSSELLRPLLYSIKEWDNKRYRSERKQFYSRFVRKGDIVFDIGANIGNRTEIFDELGCSVVAVEPQKQCIEYLHKKFQGKKNIFLVEKAVSDKVQTSELFICGSDASSSMSTRWINSVQKNGRLNSLKWEQKVMVQTITLDELIKRYGKPMFCKIDVEGYELQVLKGLSQPIPILSFEFLADFRQSALNCIKELLRLGKPTFNYSFGESMKFVSKTWITGTAMCTILASLPKHSQGDVYVRFTHNKTNTRVSR